MQEIQEGALAGDGRGHCTSGVSRRPIGPICPIGPTAVPKTAQEMQEIQECALAGDGRGRGVGRSPIKKARVARRANLPRLASKLSDFH